MVVRKLIKAGKNNTEFTKYGDGESVRGYTHVDDLTDVAIAESGNPLQDGDILIYDDATNTFFTLNSSQIKRRLYVPNIFVSK